MMLFGRQDKTQRKMYSGTATCLCTIFTCLTIVLATICYSSLSTSLKISGEATFRSPESFSFTVDTSNTLTFSIPTSGMVGQNVKTPSLYPSHDYNWDVNWGDGNTQNATGTSSKANAGIAHIYTSAGLYKITISSHNTPTSGWFNAFGFCDDITGANTDTNKSMLRSIDSQFTPKMRTTGLPYRFAYMFYNCINASSIPGNLFSLINDTGGATDLSYMFRFTFNNYAYNSTSATIPAGLFSTINTSSATNLSLMFDNTFNNYAYNSTSGTIPAGLFSTINTNKATNLSYMFCSTFNNYAYNSTSGTIPAGLFSTINTSTATNLSYMFNDTFNSYAYNSVNATIPAGLFDTIDASKATDLSYMFNMTFYNYAYNSANATIPAKLFDKINLNVALEPDLSYMFGNTFQNYAYANKTICTKAQDILGNANFGGQITSDNSSMILFRTFYNMPSLGGTAQTFIDKFGTNPAVIPSNPAQVFIGTSITDVSRVHVNWGGQCAISAAGGVIDGGADYSMVCNDTTVGTFTSNNAKVDNSTAYTRLKYDLTSTTEDKQLTVNYTISSEPGCDFGYVTANNSASYVPCDTTDGRFIYASGATTTSSATYVLPKGKVWYIHMGYSKNGSINANNDSFTINSVALENVETFCFTVDTRLTSTGATTGTSTAFSIPTSGHVGASSSNPDPANAYNWSINWGDGNTQTAIGTSSTTSAGIAHTYASAGQYQITIRPNDAVSNGWFDAFGFLWAAAGANSDTNKAMFKSIDSPFAPKMRTPGATYRFAYTFFNCVNGTSIPTNLFSLINDTGSATDLSHMFECIFYNYAFNSTSATIPAGLFSTINTSSATDLSYMFYNTFAGYAYNSTSGTIPAGLFSTINTSSATNVLSMFCQTFAYYANAKKIIGTNIQDIWSNANFDGKVTAANSGGSSGVFYQTFYDMPSLGGTAQTFIDNKLGSVIPSAATQTFTGTSITDVSRVHVNWGGQCTTSAAGSVIDGGADYSMVCNDTTAGKFTSNNAKVDNSTAYTRLKYDLTSATEDKQLTVNYTISSESGYDFGYVTANNSASYVPCDTTDGRFIYASGETTTANANYALTKGKVWYIHMGYNKNGSTNANNDNFTINSVKMTSLAESFSFTVDTRLLSDGTTAGTSTAFSIPTSGFVGNTASHTYNWNINWGDGNIQTASGTGSRTSAGITHTYASAGQYQIAIKPNGTAYNGWFDAFGFFLETVGANAATNKAMFKSIDSQFTPIMRTSGVPYRFAYTFFNCVNASSIPANLFSLINDTGSATDFSHMFEYTFFCYAYNSTNAVIPAGLLSTIDTSNAISLAGMFNGTFNNYAYNSTSATIPAGLFSTINTNKATNLAGMFYSTFYTCSYKSNSATIPTGLFSTINTSSATDVSSMFYQTFTYYAFSSTSATIPANLFSTINTSSATDVSSMFYQTFAYYAYSSTSGTIPAGLLSTINTSSATNMSNMFNCTFWNYAYNSTSGTIPAGLFTAINTSNATSLSCMFSNTFAGYAYNSTTGTIPANLFSAINTSSATDLSNMFRSTFSYYAFNSTSATIPSGLFSTINTSSATNVSYMFYSTFCYYAYQSTAGTIPSGLFSTINTSNATNVSYMFRSTFYYYAYKSTSGTIPSGLFNTINTSNATDLSFMFNITFSCYAYNSTTGTIPTNLFSAINTSSATDVSSMFCQTFAYYANARTSIGTNIQDIWGNANFGGKVTAANAGGSSGVFYQTFYNMASLGGTALTFITQKLGGIIPSTAAQTFTGTQVSDLASLNANWK